jgi:sugar lactone lactonase YvrE
MARVFSQPAAFYRWLHAPVGLLVVLLQRTPVVRLADQVEYVTEICTGSTVRSLFALGALGAYNSLAGASGTTITTTTSTGTTTTTIIPSSNLIFAATDSTPSSGPAGTAFTVTSNLGAAMNVDFTLTGGVTNPKSWIVSGTLPDGLTVSGGNPVNVGVPYKLTISGTPTMSGVWTVTLTAYDGVDETGAFRSITCIFVVAQNAVTAPVIITQPADAIGFIGGSVTLTAVASGSPVSVYKWYRGSQLLAGQTTQSLTLTNLQASDAGSYTMTATNAVGSVTTAPAIVTVDPSAVTPTITSQPQGATVTELTPVTFSASASGTVTLTYQWNKDGVAIAGATLSSYEIPLAHVSDAGNYTVTVTNSAGSVTSAPATLTVNALQTAPTIVNQPQSVTLTAGSSVSFTVKANGTSPLAYQWSKAGASIAGATASSYSIPQVHAADAGDYTVTVTNNNGAVTSNPATLTINAAQVTPIISTQPQNETVAPGSSASFTVVAVGSDPLAYQWMFNGAAITGATSATYTNSSVQPGDAGTYTVVVSNGTGSATSQGATLAVSAAASATTAPVFTAQPVSDTVASGHGATFTAAVSSNLPANYQWQVSSDGGATWSALSDSSTYSGTNSATLTVSNVTSAMNGYHYRLVASNTAGSTITNGLTLAVAAPPFPGPFGMAIDASGDLFISDGSNNTIQFVTPAGAVSLLAGASGQQGSTDGSYGSALFRQPHGIALDKSENLYVADTGNSIIRKITPAGVVTTLAGSSTTQGYIDATGTAAVFNSPQALAVDGSGNVYVADTGNSAIRQISPAGVVTTIAGSGFKGSADGTRNGATFNQPSGIVLDSAGNLYVSDTLNDTIRKITPADVVTTLAGVAGVGGYADGPGTTALFNHPTGLAIDGSGNIYVADTGNEIIRVVAPDGTVRSLAGLPTIAGLLDGTGMNAWFNQPESLSLDSSGNLYVTDNGNAAIRKVTSAGVVTTLVLQQTTATPSIPAPANSNSSSTSTSSGSTSGTGSTSTASSGGGGTMEPGFVLALLALAAVRRRLRALRRGPMDA